MIFTVSYEAYLPAQLGWPDLLGLPAYPKSRLERLGSRQTRVGPPSHIKRTTAMLRGNKV